MRNRKAVKFCFLTLISGALFVFGYNNCGPGFHSEGAPLVVDAASSYDPVLAAQGKTLYAQNCAKCHSELDSTSKRDRTVAQINVALSSVSVMAPLKGSLSQDQIAAISEALKSSTAIALCTGKPAGKTIVRRLNFREYSNSVRDLFGVKGLSAADFPKDFPGATGFDNDDGSIRIQLALGDAEKLVSFGEKVIDQAMGSANSTLNQCNNASSSNKTSCIQNLLLSVAKKAFRRPTALADIQPLVTIATSASTIKEGVRDALVGIISSPRFLFHLVDYTANRDGVIHTLSAHELASRMSFFIWSSIPDSELLSLADSSALLNPDIQRQQVDRMLADPKAQSLLATFPSQWLGYDGILTSDVQRSLDLHPEFNDTLRSSMVQEANLLFKDTVTRDLNVDALITANYSFVDRSLASLYGIQFPNSSSSFAVVNLDGKSRRGLLTQAAFMTATSHGDFTNPIFRGAAILGRVVCDPPGKPPFPPRPLSEVDPTLPMKERLAMHRTSTTCAACHNSIDPLGLAFENFDSIGKFRTKDGGNDIDPTGTTASGYHFNNPGELANWVVANNRFKKCMNQYLSSYGVGRQISSAEKCQSDRLVTNASPGENLSFKVLVEKLVTSDLFKKSLFQE